MMRKDRSMLYIIAEYLSAAFAIMFFAIYYGVTPYPETILTPIMMILFILFQEVWINKEMYHFFHNEEDSPQERKALLSFTILFSLAFLSPFLWVIMEVFKHFL